ncbi:M16 family metallopeptidase [Segnochrobactraceae bacterium EtOH-i3]
MGEERATVAVSKLDNGVTIATDTMAHVESAALGIWVGAGARSETAAEHGISHLLEHMAFKGTGSRSAQAIAEEIEAVGGEMNAATSVENTAYYVRLLGEDVGLGLDILSDILTDSTLDPEELEREQHVIVQELGAAQDTPEDRVFDLLQEAAFPDQPIGRPILGTEETVRGFTPAAIRHYLDTHYRGPAVVVSAAGAVNHDRLVELCGGALGGFPAVAGPAPEAARYRGGIQLEERDLNETQIVLGFEGRSYRADDYYPLQVLSSVLGGGMSSRLFQEIREKRGLCYSIYSFHWGYADTGLFGVHAATGEEDVAELVPLIVDELFRAGRDLGEVEVRRAKAQMRAGLLMARESVAARAGQTARQILTHGRPLTPAEISARLEAVTVSDVRRVAETVLSAAPTLAAVGSAAGLKALEGATARFAVADAGA